MKYTFEDYKERISIMEVAIDLGYKFDKSVGRTQPCFVLSDNNGREMDKIYIKNPQNNAIQGYWRRTLSGKHGSGDLIGFVKENIRLFPEHINARNEIDAINKVLARFANVIDKPDYKMQEFIQENKNWQPKVFNEDRFLKFQEGKVDQAMKFLTQRGISREIVQLFSNNFEIVKDQESPRNYKNIGFPYTLPGEEKTNGYELRGYGGFKSKAEGTDSTKSSWQAYLGNNKSLISQLHFAESALDIMAFVEIYKDRLNLEECLFISFGGTFSEAQLQGLRNKYPGGTLNLHFDNDLNGIVYDCRTAAILKGENLKCKSDGNDIYFSIKEKTFNIPIESFSFNTFKNKLGGLGDEIIVFKAPSPYKDWNDVLMSQKNMHVEIGAKEITINKLENERMEQEKKGGIGR